MTDPVQKLESAVDYTSRILAQVRPDQYDAPTPCTEWNVRQLVEHMVNGSRAFAAAATGEQASEAPVGDDLRSAFEEAARAEIAAFRSPGALDKKYPFPFPDISGDLAVQIHAMDLRIHGWDLAKAVGVDGEMDTAEAEDSMAFVQRVASGMPRGGEGAPFGPETTPPPNATPTQRLVAFLGRHC